MKLEINEKQSEILLELITKELDDKSNDSNSSYKKELEFLKEDILKINSNESIIEKFVSKYKYENDTVSFNGKKYDIELNIEGLDYHAHWYKNDDKIALNDFMVDYLSIINLMYESENNNVFESEEYYSELHQDFIKNLKQIGVTIIENDSDEYDVLNTYLLPVDKILDETFIKSFSDILSNYSDSFTDELNFIYDR